MDGSLDGLLAPAGEGISDAIGDGADMTEGAEIGNMLGEVEFSSSGIRVPISDGTEL